jgi:hypothetical protein
MQTQIIIFYRKIQILLFRFKIPIVLFLIFCIVSVTFSIYQISLVIKISDKFRIVYTSGSVLLEKDGVINQYQTTRGGFALDYFTSVYEPQLVVDNKLYSVYRPQPQKIKYKNSLYYFYVGESQGYLTKNPNNIPNYKTNIIVGPPLGLYGQNNTIYNYRPNEVYDSFVNNTIKIDLRCTTNIQSDCKNKLNKVGINIKKDDNEPETAIFSYNYNFGIDYETKPKQTVAAFITPEDFYICKSRFFDENCLKPVDDIKVKYQDFRFDVIDANNNIEEKITLGDLNLSHFFLLNLKIFDYYNPVVKAETPLEKNNSYYMVHKSNKVWIKLTPLAQYKADIQEQFGSIRFFSSDCPNTNCNSSVKVTVGEN